MTAVPSTKMQTRSSKHTFLKSFLWIICIPIIFAIFASLFLPLGSGLMQTSHSSFMQKARSIGLLMFQYSLDHDGKYPDGKSSTEVFQKLIDANYVNDPSIFYLPLSGKSKALQNQPLKPENVCWDVTCCLNTGSSDFLPVVFMTGYKINYIPGGAATPLIKPYPNFEVPPRTWLQWWNGAPRPPLSGSPGIAVCYKNNSAQFSPLKTPANSDGVVPNFISPQYDPAGKAYHQLTPEGSIP
ncbi:MAG TPA: hypothetical protein VGC39_08690 [Candidatus Methylacidiphilales bacterium]